MKTWFDRMQRLNIMSEHHHDHDESSWPTIWEVTDHQGKRLTMLVQQTIQDAHAQAMAIYGDRYDLIDTGKKKPPNKCCNKCGPKPCGS